MPASYAYCVIFHSAPLSTLTHSAHLGHDRPTARSAIAMIPRTPTDIEQVKDQTMAAPHGLLERKPQTHGAKNLCPELGGEATTPSAHQVFAKSTQPNAALPG